MGGWVSREEEVKPRRLVLVGGGKGAGKTRLMYRLGRLDPAWQDSATKPRPDVVARLDDHVRTWQDGGLGMAADPEALFASLSNRHEDQRFTLDVPQGAAVRMVEVPVLDDHKARDAQRGFVADARKHALLNQHPFPYLFMTGTRWCDIDAVVWIVNGASLATAKDDDLALKMLHVILGSAPPDVPLLLLVNRAEASTELVQRTVRAFASVLEQHCQSHSDTTVKTASGHFQSPLERRPWSIYCVDNPPSCSERAAQRGSLALPILWLQRALDGDANVRLFTQRLQLPKDSNPDTISDDHGSSCSLP